MAAHLRNSIVGQPPESAIQTTANAPAKPLIFKEGWLNRVFDSASVMQSVKEICNPPKAAWVE